MKELGAGDRGIPLGVQGDPSRIGHIGVHVGLTAELDGLDLRRITRSARLDPVARDQDAAVVVEQGEDGILVAAKVLLAVLLGPQQNAQPKPH